MSTRDPRVDAYIAKAAPFARPILKHLRAVVHETCPGVEEAMKWSFPHFLYKGMFCSMAAFTRHCAFTFWKGDLLFGPRKGGAERGMGHLGRITAFADLPSKRTLAGYLRKAMRLNDEGAKPRWLERRGAKRAATPRRGARRVTVPADLAAALRKNAKARAAFAKFPPSHRREYVEWITGATREETRARRLATAVAWIAEGKSQNWRYERK
jgi:hypothetical protein